MDPLHPFVPITPPPPTAPTYARVERIERDGPRQPGPNWEQQPDGESQEKPPEEQYEDDYDPNWEDPAAAEPYGPDGAHHEGVQHEDSVSVDLSPEDTWDPLTHADRRSSPREPDQDGDPDAGHIDISA